MAAPTRRDFCTPDHCVYPYCPDTFHKPIFEINETDSIGIKESKTLILFLSPQFFNRLANFLCVEFFVS